MKTWGLAACRSWAGAMVLLLPLGLGIGTGGEGGRPLAEATFGEVRERELPVRPFIMPQQVLLDLDTGKLRAMPTNIWLAGMGFNPRPRYNWMVKHGADLLVHSSAVSQNLTFHLDDGWLAIPGTNLTFETITASEASALARAGVFQSLVVSRRETNAGATLVFKTREGNAGVMQLLAFRAEPEPVLKLRYKLVRQPNAGK